MSHVKICLVAALCLAVTFANEHRFTHNARFDDVKPTHLTLDAVVMSYFECASKCSSDVSTCGAFGFNRETGICLGMKSRPQQTSEMTSQHGFRLYRRLPACPTDTDYVYDSWTHMRLKAYPGLYRNCHEAQSYCEGERSNLAIPRDSSQVNFTWEQIANIGYEEYIFSGRKQQGVWKWLDGTLVKPEVHGLFQDIYDCRVMRPEGIGAMQATNIRFFVCQRNVTGF